MHHRPACPSLSARCLGALTTWGLQPRVFRGVPAARLFLAGALTTLVTGLVLAVPVVTGNGSPAVVLDPSSTSTPGVDAGAPVAPVGPSGQPAGSVPSHATADAPPVEATAAGPATEEPSATPPAPAPVEPAAAASGSSPSSAGAPSVPPVTSSSTVPRAPVSVTATADPPAPVTPPAAPDPVGELIAALDGARVTAGCDPLAVDAALTSRAQAHSTAMRDEDFFALRDGDGQSPLDQGAGAAAIARGTASAADVVAGWLASPADASVIGDCSLASVGVGLVDGDDGPWWTLFLA